MKCKISNFQRGVKKISKQAAKPCRLFQTSFNIKSPQPEAAGFFSVFEVVGFLEHHIFDL